MLEYSLHATLVNVGIKAVLPMCDHMLNLCSTPSLHMLEPAAYLFAAHAPLHPYIHPISSGPLTVPSIASCWPNVVAVINLTCVPRPQVDPRSFPFL